VRSIIIHLSDTEKMKRYVNEEKQIREENLRLQRKLQLEVERREALCRHLSESESRLVTRMTEGLPHIDMHDTTVS
jgi:hypothetical protein